VCYSGAAWTIIMADLPRLLGRRYPQSIPWCDKRDAATLVISDLSQHCSPSFVLKADSVMIAV